MTENISKNKRIAKNTLFLYFRMLILIAVTLYTSRVVLHCLGVVDYGVYNVVGGMVGLFAFLNTALAQATERYIAFGIEKYDTTQQRQIFSMLMNVHILIAIITIILAETVGVWLLYNKMVIPADRMDTAFWVMQFSIFTMAISITQVPYNASIFGHERMNAFAYITILEAILKLGSVLSLKWFFADKLLAYGVLMMVVAFIVAMIYRLYCIRNFSNCHYTLFWSKPLFKELSSYTGWSLLGNLAWTLNGQGMNFLINIFFGPVYNAARGIASSVEVAITSFETNFLAPSIPPIIKAYAAGDIKEMLRLHDKSSKIGFLLFMCISVPLISVIDNVLEVWLVTPPPQADLFCVLSLVYVQCNSLGGTMQNVVQAIGRVKKFQLYNGVIKITALPIVYILYKMHSPVSTYLWILIITSFIGWIAGFIVVNEIVKEFNISSYLNNVFRREISAYIIPIIAAVYCWKIDFDIIGAIIACCIVGTITITSAWFLGLNGHERVWIKDIVRRKLRMKGHE